MSVRVKICGITSVEDALAAVEFGADALGFMLFDSSPRNIKFEGVRGIIRRLPPFVTRVGVFVNAPETLVRQGIAAGINTLQFHGDEGPEFCASFGLATYKAFRIRDSSSLQDLRRYETSAWLLDTFVTGQSGGTGQTFNWELAVEAKRFGRPIILAGGLTPENVGEAICKVAPYAVDVSSGVESTAGRKDHEKVRRFIENARAATR